VQDTTATPAARRRPFGVNAIIALQLVNILTVTILALGVEALRGPTAIVDSLRLHLDLDVSGTIFAPVGAPLLYLPGQGQAVPVTAFDLAIVALLVVNVVGLFRLRRWAWTLTMFLTGIALLVGIFQYVVGAPLYLNLLINVLIVFYLNQREVQESFQGRRRRETSP
jgi:hypothetical protein